LAGTDSVSGKMTILCSANWPEHSVKYCYDVAALSSMNGFSSPCSLYICMQHYLGWHD